MAFESLLGNERIKQNLSSAAHKNRFAHFYLICGPKGSGIAIMIDIASGILSGGGFGNHLTGLYEMTGPQGVGHFMGAIDVSHFTDLETFKQKVSQMSAEIKALKKAPGVEEILMPGDLEANKRAVNEANGIELPEPVYQELVNLGAPHGLTL